MARASGVLEKRPKKADYGVPGCCMQIGMHSVRRYASASVETSFMRSDTNERHAASLAIGPRIPTIRNWQ